ncbi:hypothetical protein NDU88_001767, partial [Pleurodeles waltl]
VWRASDHAVSPLVLEKEHRSKTKQCLWSPTAKECLDIRAHDIFGTSQGSRGHSDPTQFSLFR